jgi:hypothetical protein
MVNHYILLLFLSVQLLNQTRNRVAPFYFFCNQIKNRVAPFYLLNTEWSYSILESETESCCSLRFTIVFKHQRSGGWTSGSAMPVDIHIIGDTVDASQMPGQSSIIVLEKKSSEDYSDILIWMFHPKR